MTCAEIGARRRAELSPTPEKRLRHSARWGRWPVSSTTLRDEGLGEDEPKRGKLVDGILRAHRVDYKSEDFSPFTMSLPSPSAKRPQQKTAHVIRLFHYVPQHLAILLLLPEVDYKASTTQHRLKTWHNQLAATLYSASLELSLATRAKLSPPELAVDSKRTAAQSLASHHGKGVQPTSQPVQRPGANPHSMRSILPYRMCSMSVAAHRKSTVRSYAPRLVEAS